MHTAMFRLNEVAALALVVLGVQAALVCYSTLYHDYKNDTGPVALSLTNVKLVSRQRDNDDEDIVNATALASLRFDLETDLRDLFDWNVKQLYLYLVAEYSCGEDGHLRNQLVVWDKIVLRGGDTKVELRKKRNKYEIRDVGRNFLDSPNVTLRLAWNVIPNVGRLQDIVDEQLVTFAFSPEGGYKSM